MTRSYLPLIILIGLLSMFSMRISYSLAEEAEAAKQEAAKSRELAKESAEYQVQLMNITMYAPLSPGAVRGRDYSGNPSLTASGEKLVPGKTAAAGPNIPFGTAIYVEGLGWRTVQDRGSAIGPSDIDLAVFTKKEAINFGKQERLVIIKLPPEENS